MNFQEALKKLGIEDYQNQIWNSNSRGELFHIYDYIILAQKVPDERLPEFRPWFEGAIEWAKENWDRPQSIFQHILKMAHNKK